MAEKTAELVGLVDINQIDDQTKLALKTIQSVNAKLAAAKANPIWDPTTVAATLVERDGALMLDTAVDDLRIAVDQRAQFAPWLDKPVIATGFVKAVGWIEVTKLVERNPNTLEMAVMSLCPFAKRAEAAVIGRIQKTLDGAAPPSLGIRYIFYKKQENGASAWSAMHGEEEIRENLVQMVIRDRFQPYFADYILQRAGSEAPWQALAAEIGLDPGAIAEIENALTTDRDALIEAEHEYLTQTYGITDGSPQFIWESQLAPDIRKVPAFADLDLSGKNCSRP